MSIGERIGIIIGVVGVVLMGVQVWDILDRRGAIGIAFAVSIWAISSVMVGYSVYRNFKDAHRAESKQAKLDNAVAQHTAEMQAADRHCREKLAAVRAECNQLVDRIASHNDEILEMDARHQKAILAEHDKFLVELRNRVTAAVASQEQRHNEEKRELQGSLRMEIAEVNSLREDASARDKAVRLKIQVLQNQIEELKSKDTQKAERDKEIIRNAPRLSVEHRYDYNKQCDVLLLGNDKDEHAMSLNFDPIQVLVTHRIVSNSPIAPITGGGPKRECPVVVYNGATDEQVKLYDALRDNPRNAVNRVRIHYSDGLNRMFYRDYVLKEDPASRIVIWEAESVCLAS